MSVDGVGKKVVESERDQKDEENIIKSIVVHHLAKLLMSNTITSHEDNKNSLNVMCDKR